MVCYLANIGEMFFANTLGSIFTIMGIIALAVAVIGFGIGFLSDTRIFK